MTQDNPLMEHSIVCPKCGSTQVEKRNHEQNLQKIGGVLLGSAGTAAGTATANLDDGIFIIYFKDIQENIVAAP